MSSNALNLTKAQMVLDLINEGRFTLLENNDVYNTKTKNVVGSRSKTTGRWVISIAVKGDTKLRVITIHKSIFVWMFHKRKLPDPACFIIHDNNNREDFSKDNIIQLSRKEYNKRLGPMRRNAKQHPANSKLTAERVAEMRKLYRSDPKATFASLGIAFGVSKITAMFAVTGRTFSYLPDAFTEKKVVRKQTNPRAPKKTVPKTEAINFNKPFVRLPDNVRKLSPAEIMQRLKNR
jgi:hypothetical protein